MTNFDVSCLWPSCRCPTPDKPDDINMTADEWTRHYCMHRGPIATPTPPMKPE